VSEIRRADVDHRGLLRVLGENLYSTPHVVVRELVQNAHDSIARRRLESGQRDRAGLAGSDSATAEGTGDDDFVPRIDVIADPGAGTLTVRDTGAGLTHDEIHRYLATIGAGYTRVLRAETSARDLIGAFGLGFLSAYVVSEQVQVTTTSHREPAATWRFRSSDGLSYSVTEAEPAPPGTEVVLSLTADHAELADPHRVGQLLARYARLLDYPVFAPGRVNGGEVPWRESSREQHPRRRERVLLTAAASFERGHEPLWAIEVEPSEELDVRGMLWVQASGRWATSDTRYVSLYVRGMFVSDEVRAVLPEWAGFVGGVLECDTLVPTASREDVQRDDGFLRLQARVTEQLVQGLCDVATGRPEVWRRIVLRHADALRGAALASPVLFEALAEVLPVPTSEGDLTLPEIAAAGPIHATVGDDSGYELVLHRAQGRPVIEGVRFGSLALAQRWGEANGTPVVVLGTAQAERALFPRVEVSDSVRARLEGWFAEDDRAVVPSRFAPPTVPMLLVPDRDVLLKRTLEDDDADRRLSRGILGLARLYTEQLEDGPRARLFVNLDAAVVRRLLEVDGPRADAVAAVLWSFTEVSGRRAGEASQTDLGTALEALDGALVQLLAQ